MTIIALILLLSFLVIIHELGHLFAAFWAKIKVEEFGIGYPPMARKLFVWNGVPFTLNWIPFGGFVRMTGEDENTTNHTEKGKGHFHSASVFRRLVVILAGASVNFIFGVLAFSIAFSVMGIPVFLSTARIGFVAPDSPAAAAHLPTDVDIIAFEADGSRMAITNSTQVISYVNEHRGKTVTVVTTGPCTGTTCAEKAQEFTTYLRTEAETPQGQGSLGIAFKEYEMQFYPWWQMPFRGTWFGILQALDLGNQIITALRTLAVTVVFNGQVPSELAGPVGIVHQAQSAGLLSQGWLAVLSFAGMLSINLAVMNVLPIPPLDGGKAAFTILEPFVADRYLRTAEYWVNYVGYIALLALILVITARDVFRIFF
ncbi:site-2 protease family protein [Candidatus Woesebacteria bacterium]|nr:site-2 protease family protein [Candidatus Woesebacteria bacterium]